MGGTPGAKGTVHDIDRAEIGNGPRTPHIQGKERCPMPLDRFVLLIVIVIAAAMATVWIGALVVSATAVPLGWLALIPAGLAAWLGWRVIAERLGNAEDDHYDRMK
jgi:hypothetical protein